MTEENLRKEREKLAEMNKEKENNYEKININDVNNYHYRRPQNTKKKSNTPLIILIILLSFISGLGGAYVTITYFATPTTSTTTNTVELTETNSIASAVEKVYDSTVVVESYQNNTLVSTGTGFAYKKDKNKIYVMTNNHVISGADKVKLILSDSSEIDATVTGADTYSDIAVLSVKATDKLTVAATGDNEKTRVGDTVFAVGAPEGSDYAGTVTKGVLSGKDRLVAVSFSSSDTSDYYMNVIQTDAAINPGNSGGPLCNANGEVIGITNMKLVDSSVEGMGFAIPIEDALYYAEILETQGKVTRPYIGISMLDITTNSYYLWKANIQIPEGVTEGVVVYSVEENSPASSAGLQKGDIITKMGDEKIESLASFRYQLYKHEAGSEITLTINRNGKEETVKVKLGTSES